MSTDVITGTDTTVADGSTHEDAVVASDDLLEDELLVEEVSIDGMCGVY
jgi:mycofactocin precursor